jgi:hypothetical protein
MAERTRGGVSGYAVALVIFVILFVFSVVIGVLGWSQAAKSEKDVAAAKTTETNALRDKNQAKDENEKLKIRMVGNKDMLLADVNNVFDKDLNVTLGVPLRTAIEALRIKLMDNDTDLKTLGAERDKLNARFKAAEDARETVAQDYKTSLKVIEDKIAAANKARDDTKKQLDDELAKAKKNVEDMKAKYDKDLVGKDKELADKAQVVADLKKQIGVLEARLSTKNPINLVADPSILPKGKIIRVSSDDNLVYIDRGRANHVVLGLTFEVYDRNGVIGKDQFNELNRGKATIEVVHVDENTSSARIVRQSRGLAVVDGDTIANLFYDPNLVLNVFVYGKFDLDNSGQPNLADKKRIEGMVGEWGAKVVKGDLPGYETDLVVLGQEPKLPDPPQQGETDRMKIEQFEQGKAEYLQYQQVKGEATKLKLPMIAQNKLLILTGYYQRVPSAAPAANR